jgi:hypothetical protein
MLSYLRLFQNFSFWNSLSGFVKPKLHARFHEVYEAAGLEALVSAEIVRRPAAEDTGKPVKTSIPLFYDILL